MDYNKFGGHFIDPDDKTTKRSFADVYAQVDLYNLSRHTWDTLEEPAKKTLKLFEKASIQGIVKQTLD